VVDRKQLGSLTRPAAELSIIEMRGKKMKTKIYRGVRTEHDGCIVTVNSTLLNPHHDVLYCSGLKGRDPGFGWGYCGQGPSQLSIAILTDWTGNGERARKNCDEFQARIIAKLPGRSWELQGEKVEHVLFQIAHDGRKESGILGGPPPPFCHLNWEQ
jgi:hypothetical protein